MKLPHAPKLCAGEGAKSRGIVGAIDTSMPLKLRLHRVPYDDTLSLFTSGAVMVAMISGKIDADFLERATERMRALPEMTDVAAIVASFSVTIIPGRLGDTNPVLFTTSLWGVDSISLNQNEPAKGSIVFRGDKGRLTASLAGMQGFSAYIECTGNAPDAGKPLRWDALVSDAGPVSGRMTIVPGTQDQYFATPPAGNADFCHFTIDAMTGDVWPPDDRWLISEVRLLAFAAV